MIGLTFPRTAAQQRPSRTTAPPGARTPATSLPTHDQIAQRAYEIYVRGGRVEGRGQEDWLQAEHELLEETRALQDVPAA
jgi:hypothetical protein